MAKEDTVNENATAPSGASPPGAPAEGPAAAAPEVSRPSELEIAALQARAKERDELHGKYLRALADFENYQKRARREQDRFREEALRDVLKELTLVVDNLDLALASSKIPEGGSAGATLETVARGVSVVRDQLLRVLSQRGVDPLGTKPGEPFDPDRHEAVMMAPGDGNARDEVGLVAREGYKLGSTILRPASVQVKKAGGAPAGGAPAGGA